MRGVTRLSFLAIIAVAFAAVTWSGPALAGPCVTSNPGIDISTWTSCAHGDKTFTQISHSTSLDGAFVRWSPSSPGDVHIFNQTGDLGPGDYSLAFTVLITDFSKQFDTVQVSMVGSWAAPFLDTTASKHVYGETHATDYGTIISQDTGASSISVGNLSLPDGVLFLEINETVHVADEDFVTGITNTFVQEAFVENHSEPLPEPMTLALAGIGLVALGFARRRRTHA